MSTTDGSAAARLYAEAYASHYSKRDLLVALRSYENVIALHPASREADYSRAQIRNIVNMVVPAKELLSAQLELVLRYLERDVVDSTTTAVS